MMATRKVITDKYFYKKEFWLPIYDRKIIFILTNNRKKLRTLYGRDFGDLYSEELPFAETLRATKEISRIVIDEETIVTSQKAKILILNLWYNDDKITYGTIAHECFHIANYVLGEIGYIVTGDADEPMGNLIGYIYDEVLKFIRTKKLEGLIE